MLESAADADVDASLVANPFWHTSVESLHHSRVAAG